MHSEGRALERALVTGAAGFIGSGIVRALAKSGAEVHAVVHPRTDPWRLARVASAAEVVVHRVDVADLDVLAPVVAGVQPTSVFHAAAPGGHPASAPDRMLSWGETVFATLALLECLRPLKVRSIVHVGSSLEYAPSDRPLSETDPERPTTARGAMKLASTVAVRQWGAETGCPVAVVRPFSVYGPTEPEGRLIPTLMSCVRTGAPVRTTSGTYRRDFVYIDDVVEACLRAGDAAVRAGPSGTVVNVGTGVETSTDEVVELIRTALGLPLAVDRGGFPPRAADTEHWCADTSRASEVLGWAPSVDLVAGLSHTYSAPLCESPR